MAEADVTQMLLDLESGRREAFDRLLAHVYPALRDIARARMREQRDGHTFSPTDLVHEAYLKLARYQDVSWRGRAHFFGAAAQTMRRILVDHARSKHAAKRAGAHVTLSGLEISDGHSLQQLIELDDALERLAEHRPRWVQIIECRCFGGLTIEETAEVLGIAHGTVSNDWRLARAWLRHELGN